MKKRILAAIMSACMLVTMGIPMVTAADNNYGTAAIEKPASTANFEFGAGYTASNAGSNTSKMLHFQGKLTKGNESYGKNVLFKFQISADNGAKVQAWAQDTLGAWFDLAETGYWGPDGGFTIATATTNVYVAVDKECKLTVSGGLVDAADDTTVVPMTGDTTYNVGYGSVSITKPESGESNGLLANAPASSETPSLPKFTSNLTKGTIAYSNNVQFQFDITTDNGAKVQAWAKDTLGAWFDLAEVGYWGPENGFSFAGDASTDVYIATDKDCKVSMTGKLVDMVTNKTVLTFSDSKDMTVAKKTVTFNTNGGSAIDPQTVVANNAATKPSNPTRDGYIFVGWFTNDALTNAYDFTAKVTSDTTLYAAWVKAEDSNTEVIVPEPSKDVPEIKVDNKVTEQVPLTDEEQAAIKAGDKLEVSFDVKKIEAPANADVIEAVLGENQKVGMYLDITMFKKIGNSAGVAVTELNGKIRMTLTIPEELRGQVSYQIVRVHNGVATVLVDLDTDPNTITFETDEFSTYALTYTATAVDNSSSNSSSGSSSTGDKTPSTGDATTSVVGLIALAALSLTATGIIVKSKKSGKTK